MLREFGKLLKVTQPLDRGTKIWTQGSVSSPHAFNLLVMTSTVHHVQSTFFLTFKKV